MLTFGMSTGCVAWGVIFVNSPDWATSPLASTILVWQHWRFSLSVVHSSPLFLGQIS